jgi:hypothetical protein
MTYQRNIGLDVEENVADEPAQNGIRSVEIGTDDGDGDDDDDGRGEELALARPLDLLQLGRGLGNEDPEAPAALTARAGLALRLADGLDFAAARAGALGGGRLLVLAAPATSGSALGHYLVSRWRVWRPHQRQYFFTSNRSGVFRFDLFVW